jgi:integrase
MENRPKKKLLDLVREAIERKHYSKRTEEAYIHWIKRYIFFHNKRHPLEMGNQEIEAFLTHLAVKKQVSASTQNQAFSALLFLYREVLNKPLEGPINSLRAKRPKRLPTVLTREETFKIIQCMSGVYQLMTKLLYGSGLRLSECVELRVKDVDFAQCQIIVRDATGSSNHASKEFGQTTTGTSETREKAIPRRLEERWRFGLSSLRFGTQIPRCQS